MDSYSRVSIYKLSVNSESVIFDQYGQEFDAFSYSEFKYGNKQLASQYARTLVSKLLEIFPSLMAEELQVVTVSSPFKFVSTASANLEEYIRSLLTVLRFQYNLPAVDSVSVHRGVEATGDSSKLSQAERESHNVRNTLQVDTTVFENKHVLVIDDIRITGKHEQKMWKLISPSGFGSCTFVYIAEVDQQVGSNNPLLEDMFNHARIKTLHDLDQMLIANQGHKINARLNRFLMEQTSLSELELFLDRRTDLFIFELAIAYLGDEYFKVSKYRQNIAFILQYAVLRGVLSANYLPKSIQEA